MKALDFSVYGHLVTTYNQIDVALDRKGIVEPKQQIKDLSFLAKVCTAQISTIMDYSKTDKCGFLGHQGSIFQLPKLGRTAPSSALLSPPEKY